MILRTLSPVLRLTHTVIMLAILAVIRSLRREPKMQPRLVLA
jgi:hypothetical protein